MSTKTEVKGALAIVQAMAETIRELGSVASGTLYAQLLGTMSFNDYGRILTILKGAKLIVESDSHLLTWKGGK